ncbi:hypothetical protein NXH76_14965 [Blautia schinkii]|nr:hypothetical protein [Blautia schinkii]
MEDRRAYVRLCTPNIEIHTIYRDKVLGWFGEKTQQRDLSRIYQAIWYGIAFYKKKCRIVSDAKKLS